MEFLDGPGLNSLIVGRSPQLDGRRLDPAEPGGRGDSGCPSRPALSIATFVPQFRRQPRGRFAQTDRLRAKRSRPTPPSWHRAIGPARPTTWRPKWCGAGRRRRDWTFFRSASPPTNCARLPCPGPEARERGDGPRHRGTESLGCQHRPQINPSIGRSDHGLPGGRAGEERAESLDGFLKMIKGSSTKTSDGRPRFSTLPFLHSIRPNGAS